MSDYNTIAESNNFIILDQYSKQSKASESYQSEYDLESEFIQDLVNQGYQYLPSVTNLQAMLANVREQLQTLNHVQFTEGEWLRFVETYLDKPSDSITDKTRKIHEALPDLWLKLYWMIHFAFLAFAEGLAVPRY